MENDAKVAYKGKYDGFMVSIGSHYGVAFLMGKYHLSGFFAMLMKHLVNIKILLRNLLIILCDSICIPRILPY